MIQFKCSQCGEPVEASNDVFVLMALLGLHNNHRHLVPPPGNKCSLSDYAFKIQELQLDQETLDDMTKGDILMFQLAYEHLQVADDYSSLDGLKGFIARTREVIRNQV